MIRLFRDITIDGGGYTSTTRYNSEELNESIVKTKYPKAFLKRSEGSSFYTYQVRVKTGWFSSKAIGLSHFFKDQAWASAAHAVNEGV